MKRCADIVLAMIPDVLPGRAPVFLFEHLGEIKNICIANGGGSNRWGLVVLKHQLTCPV